MWKWDFSVPFLLPDYIVLQAADWNSSFSHPARKIVVITSCLLSDAHRFILRCLGNHGTISHCTVLTAVSEVCHPLKGCILLFFRTIAAVCCL
jgi:hypothetical protein